MSEIAVKDQEQLN